MSAIASRVPSVHTDFGEFSPTRYFSRLNASFCPSTIVAPGVTDQAVVAVSVACWLVSRSVTLTVAVRVNGSNTFAVDRGRTRKTNVWVILAGTVTGSVGAVVSYCESAAVVAVAKARPAKSTRTAVVGLVFVTVTVTGVGSTGPSDGSWRRATSFAVRPAVQSAALTGERPERKAAASTRATMKPRHRCRSGRNRRPWSRPDAPDGMAQKSGAARRV
ncbi:MAG: hypothetical protein HY814_12495 [Candidatus Riflebacteria bacterium]|nr:hypothetical protein [Candidatus Riflebacteria bacterium]